MFAFVHLHAFLLFPTSQSFGEVDLVACRCAFVLVCGCLGVWCLCIVWVTFLAPQGASFTLLVLFDADGARWGLKKTLEQQGRAIWGLYFWAPQRPPSGRPLGAICTLLALFDAGGAHRGLKKTLEQQGRAVWSAYFWTPQRPPSGRPLGAIFTIVVSDVWGVMWCGCECGVV